MEDEGLWASSEDEWEGWPP